MFLKHTVDQFLRRTFGRTVFHLSHRSMRACAIRRFWRALCGLHDFGNGVVFAAMIFSGKQGA